MISLELRERKIEKKRPLIMGILNVTPDSFYDGGRYADLSSQLEQVEKMLREGADIIDIGGESTRPGSQPISSEEELKRILPIVREVRRLFPDALISVDTYKADVAKVVIEEGVDLINDISGGAQAPEIWHHCERGGVGYVLSHFKGDPPVMEREPSYSNVVEEILKFFAEKINLLKNFSIKTIIIDPGIGFGKKVEHNYQILAKLEEFKKLGYPLLIGLSRKSLLWKLLELTPEEVLPATIALNAISLIKGADILRVHDISPALQTIAVVEEVKKFI